MAATMDHEQALSTVPGTPNVKKQATHPRGQTGQQGREGRVGTLH